MKHRTALLAAGGLAAALALTGCRDTAPGFAPAAPGWPVGYAAVALEPGMWTPGTRTNPGAARACWWRIYVAGNPLPVDMGQIPAGSVEPVALAEGVKFASTDCGGWHQTSPANGVS